MGRPKFSRKKYETPSHPWQEDRIKAENELTKKYGLKNKREIWKAETKLRNYRGQARELLAKVRTGDPQSKKESDQLLMSLSRMNILKANATLDDVLALNTESILSRRLQTLTYLKGLASTPTQARQLIAHGHIAIGGRKVTVPGYIVTKEEEGDISYTTQSALNETMHPARPRSDFKSVPVKKEDKQEKPADEKPKEKPGKKKEPEAEPKTKEVPSEESPKDEEPKEEKTDTKEVKKEPPVTPPVEEKTEPVKQEPAAPTVFEKQDDEKTEPEDNSKEKKEGGQ